MKTKKKKITRHRDCKSFLRPEWSVVAEFQYPSIYFPDLPLASRNHSPPRVRSLLFRLPFRLAPSASLLPRPGIYYHPAGNITAVFIAARRISIRSSYLPLLLSELFESWFFDFLSARETQTRRGKLRALLFRTNSGIGNQLYRCYNRISDCGNRETEVRGCKDGGCLRERISLL